MTPEFRLFRDHLNIFNSKICRGIELFENFFELVIPRELKSLHILLILLLYFLFKLDIVLTGILKNVYLLLEILLEQGVFQDFPDRELYRGFYLRLLLWVVVF